MQQLHVIKIGGAVINDSAPRNQCLEGLAKLSSPFVLVHGGGRKVNQWLNRIDHPVQMVQGRRITDELTLELAVMAYAGLVNKQIVSGLQARGIHCLGLTGADLNAITAEKRSPVPVDFGYVGDITNVNDTAFSQLLDLGITPVCSAITHDGHGQLLNTNADTIASEIAAALARQYQVTLWYAFEKKGVLADLSKDDSVIKHINTNSYQELLATGKIHDGMKPKLSNAFSALKKGVGAVHIFSATKIQDIPNVSGTKITLQ